MKRSLVHISPLAAGTTLLVLTSLSCLDPCDNTLVTEVSSPDGKWSAVAFKRSCGATTADSTHVSLLRSDASLPRAGGNLAVFEPDIQSVAPDVSLRWRSANELEVANDPRVRWFRQEAAHVGVRVGYIGTARRLEGNPSP